MKAIKIPYGLTEIEPSDPLVRAHLIDQASKKINTITKTFEAFAEMGLKADQYQVAIKEEALEITFNEVSHAILFKLTFSKS